MKPLTWRKCLLSVVCLGCYLLSSGCDNDSVTEAVVPVKEAFRPVAETFREITGLGLSDPGVVATVNNTPLFLRQVEAYSDMRTLTYSTGQGITLEDLWSDYAASLYELIVQELIRQELHKQDLQVDEEEVLKLEAVIGKSYGMSPGPELDREIERNDINPEYWRVQLRSRLEQELLEEFLLARHTFTPDEVEEYLTRHPEVSRKPETFDYLLVESLDRAVAERNRKAGQKDLAELRDAGLSAATYSRELALVPEVWRSDIRNLRPDQVSAQVRQNGLAFSYIVLLGKYEARDRTPVELYNLAQASLAEETLPVLYNDWLESVLRESEIKVAQQFLPKNVPAPSSTPRFVLPWERQDESLAEEGLGEVEGEVSTAE